MSTMTTVTALDKVIYTAKVHTTGGRDGAARSSDGSLDVKLATPGTGAGRARIRNNCSRSAGPPASMSCVAHPATRNGKSLSRPTGTSTPRWTWAQTRKGTCSRARLNVHLPGSARAT